MAAVQEIYDIQAEHTELAQNIRTSVRTTIEQLSHKNLTSEGLEGYPVPDLPQEPFTGQKARGKPVALDFFH